jgi:CheY-like chemotaxis protein
MISKLTDHPEIKNHLDLIKQTIFDGADKIRGIQDFARHKSEEKLMTIDINALLAAVLKITEPKWRNESINNGIIIEPIINFEKNLYITGVESDLRNCFANVIFNAVDAMPEGGLIKISTWFKNNYAFISVKDTGIGMTNVVKEKIFDPFYTTKGDKGTGMGMSEVYGIVKRHNGFIDINSEIGVGTEFIISFPARIMAEKNIKPEVSNHFAKLSLMAVSPYQVHREYIQKICSAYEMNLIILEHHRGAFEKFQKQRPLVMITNLQYPEMAGLKLAQEVKQYKRNTVTVLIPENIISQEEQNFFTRTFDHIINPPFTLDKVKIEIGQILQSVKEKQE